MSRQDDATNALAHTGRNCRYHVVFAPKCRRKAFFNEKRADMRDMIKTLCDWKGVEIIEGEICPDHVHLLLAIPPKLSVISFHGISERQEFFDDVSKVWKHEVCISE